MARCSLRTEAFLKESFDHAIKKGKFVMGKITITMIRVGDMSIAQVSSGPLPRPEAHFRMDPQGQASWLFYLRMQVCKPIVLVSDKPILVSIAVFRPPASRNMLN